MRKLSGAAMCCAALLLSALLAICGHAQTLTKLVDFNGANGAVPDFMSLIQGIDGNFYGTTNEGGANNAGTVFSMTPAGTLTTLYSFCEAPDCIDGSFPRAGLVQGNDGKLYGTTVLGGTAGYGTVFGMTYSGTLTTLHNFNGDDGVYPSGALIEAADGDFYGTTFEGGSFNNDGSIFKLTSSGTLTTLHAFQGGDGAYPEAGLLQASDGNFYGTTDSGGPGYGTLFKMTPQGTLTTLLTFDRTDGAYPDSQVIQGIDSGLYWTTSQNNTGGYGTVNRLTPLNQWRLFAFNDFNGAYPFAGLVEGTDGAFYGTTSQGGDLNCILDGCGTIFKITANGALTTLYVFQDATNGAVLLGGLFQATNGNFYGTTAEGGANGDGTVFTLSTGLGPFVSFLRNPAKTGLPFGILGQGFTGTTSVMLNGISATFTVVSDTFIKATVPQGATTGYVTVATPTGVLTSNVPFHVIQ
jgi:uncharacterized repeat protein (TIGR03803 family)